MVAYIKHTRSKTVMALHPNCHGLEGLKVAFSCGVVDRMCWCCKSSLQMKRKRMASMSDASLTTSGELNTACEDAKCSLKRGFSSHFVAKSF